MKTLSKMPKALIVEDEAIIALDLAEMIEGWGWEVVGPASEADQGIRLAEAERPDVAIVDIQFLRGKSSGIDVAASIQGRLGIPVVYLSGLTEERLTYTARFTHPFAFIRKPLDEASLRLVLEGALREPGFRSAKG